LTHCPSSNWWETFSTCLEALVYFNKYFNRHAIHNYTHTHTLTHAH